MSKTTTAPHLLPTDDLRSRLDREVGGLTLNLKNRGLDWLFYDLDGKTVVAHYFPAQSLLNIHAGGSARPSFQANGCSPDDIPGLLKRHLNIDEGEIEVQEEADELPRSGVPVESDLSERQRDLLFKLVVAVVGNPQPPRVGDSPEAIVRYCRNVVLAACAIKAQDQPIAGKVV